MLFVDTAEAVRTMIECWKQERSEEEKQSTQGIKLTFVVCVRVTDVGTNGKDYVCCILLNWDRGTTKKFMTKMNDAVTFWTVNVDCV